MINNVVKHPRPCFFQPRFTHLSGCIQRLDNEYAKAYHAYHKRTQEKPCYQGLFPDAQEIEDHCRPSGRNDARHRRAIGAGRDRAITAQKGATMNLLLEEKVCVACLQPRPLPWFVGDGHAFVLLDSCSFCRVTLSLQEQKLSYNKCRAKRIVLLNNRRARQRALPADLTVEQWIEVLGQSHGYCYHCHSFIGEQTLVLDHLVPLALGGGTTLSNVVPSCQRCNADKRSRTVVQWRHDEARQELDRLQKRRGKEDGTR